MPPHKRLNWEFYAVLQGRLSPWWTLSQSPDYRSDTLWIFAPDCAHGWIGEPHRVCEVAVFHFIPVPVELEHRVPVAGCLAVPLIPADKERISRFVEELRPHYQQPTALSELYFGRVMMELSLLVLEKREVVVLAPPAEPAVALPGEITDVGLPGQTNHAPVRVLAAERWFRLHLADNPSLEQVARACGLSSGHLRRLFGVVRGLSPKEVFGRIRMEHAMQLLAQSDRKLADVAAECGFATASQFCQTFKVRNGTTPDYWRRHVCQQYQDPGRGRSKGSAATIPFVVQPGIEPRAG